MDALKPKWGFKDLIEKGIFADWNGSSKMAEGFCKHLQDQLATEANKLKKARRMKKPKTVQSYTVFRRQQRKCQKIPLS